MPGVLYERTLAQQQALGLVDQITGDNITMEVHEVLQHHD